VAGAGLLAGSGAWAYPGGTPHLQTDAAPYCASCHSSRSEEALAGTGARAVKELAANKHLALIENGKEGYEKLTPAERLELVRQIKALDEASTVSLNAQPKVKPGEIFKVTVDVTGGAGPVVGVGLLDVAHRWLARPVTGEGFFVVKPPDIIGQDFKEQTRWLERRPEALRRNLTFVNVLGIHSNASKGEWGRAQVVWTLQAPQKPGIYSLVAGYWYGTEKGSPLGYTEDPVRGKMVRGGGAGHSGRILFSDSFKVTVQ